MKNFKLDSRLAKDCLVLGRMNISMLLLMNNSLVPWFILVPKTAEKEIYDLSSAEQASLMQEINTISAFIKDNFDITKLNVASIGNIVSQLHVHVVGRNMSDYCWPGVVWGATGKKPYNDAQVSKITTDLREQLGEMFT